MVRNQLFQGSCASRKPLIFNLATRFFRGSCAPQKPLISLDARMLSCAPRYFVSIGGCPLGAAPRLECASLSQGTHHPPTG